MNEAWWLKVHGERLAQGDLIPDCLLPVFSGNNCEGEPVEEYLDRARLIVITQSCDLENEKALHVAMCPIYKLAEFEAINKNFAKRGEWENVRKGRVEGLHLLASPENPENNRESLVVDFGQIVSLPIEYLRKHSGSLGNRWRLQSPFLEHFSQSFARFFMRVGLPSSIARFS